MGGCENEVGKVCGSVADVKEIAAGLFFVFVASMCLCVVQRFIVPQLEGRKEWMEV